MKEKFGLWDTKDKCWLGNDNGPFEFDTVKEAQIGATIATERMEYVIRPAVMPPGLTRLKDVIVPPISGEEAVKRIEGKIPREEKIRKATVIYDKALADGKDPQKALAKALMFVGISKKKAHLIAAEEGSNQVTVDLEYLKDVLKVEKIAHMALDVVRMSRETASAPTGKEVTNRVTK